MIDVLCEPELTVFKALMKVKLTKYDIANIVASAMYSLGRFDHLIEGLAAEEVELTSMSRDMI